MTLANIINARRVARGREPLRLAHIERAVRFVRGPMFAPTRNPAFPVRRNTAAASLPTYRRVHHV